MSPGSSTGRVVAGRYRVVSPIGSGGHGVVDLAEDLLNGGRRVALKRLEGIVGAGDPDPAAEHLRWFRHPRWAEVLDEGRLDTNGRFQVLRYVDGKSLDHVELPRPADEVLAFLEDGARVLGALHARGLIHYDVTPGNFLREERNGAPIFTLTDGGLANLGPVRGIARGTVLYMAPEVADGAPHDHRADLYALGLVAFRLATGRDPWVGGAGDVLGGRRREAAPSIRAFRPDADVRIERVIASLLERDPDRRLLDAAAVLALLAQLGRTSAATLLDGEAFATANGGFLVGRDAEVERFRTACRALVMGTAGVPLPVVDPSREAAAHAASLLSDNVLLVCGPAGSGGTRLVGEYAAIARVEGVPVLALSGREGAADRRGPLRRFADGIALLTGQSDPAAATSRADARVGREELGAGDDVRMTERFVTLCDKTADKTPLVLIVEDFEELQDSAKESIRVLARHLISRSELTDGRAPTRILLVVDHGADAPDAFLLPDALDPRRPVQLLAPLDAGALRALAIDRFAALDPLPDDLEAVRGVTEGLPRLVVSVMAQALERGHLRRENGIWIWDASQTASYELDRSISPAAVRALAALSPAAREVAEYLALLEIPVPEEFLLRLVSKEAIREFAQTPLASVSYEGAEAKVAFRTRQTSRLLGRQLSRPQSGRHAALMEALSSTSFAALEIERARLRATLGRRNEALRALSTAGKSASQTLRRRAVAIASRVLSETPHGLRHPHVRSQLATMLIDGPDGDALANAIGDAELASQSPSSVTAIHLATHFLRSRDARRARATCEHSLASIDRGANAALARAEVSVLALRTVTLGAFQDEARLLRTRALALTRRLPSTARNERRHLLAHLALSAAREAAHSLRHAQAASLSSRAARHARKSRRIELAAAAYNNMAVSLADSLDFQTAIHRLRRSIRIRNAVGDVRGATVATQNLGRILGRSGSLVAASSAHAKAYATSIRHGYSDVLVAALMSMSEIQDQLGSAALARTTLESALRATGSLQAPRLKQVLIARLTELRWATAQGDSARDLNSAPDADGHRLRESHLTLAFQKATLGAIRRQRASPLDAETAVLHPAELRLTLRMLPRLARRRHGISPARVRQINTSIAYASSALRSCLAISRGASPDVVTSLCDSLFAPTATGPSQRLAILSLLTACSLRAKSDSGFDEALLLVSRLAARRGWSLLAARFLGALAAARLARRSPEYSAQYISDAVSLLSSSTSVSGRGAAMPVGLPRELAVVARRLRGPSRTLAPSRAETIATELHAYAHRTLTSESTASPDVRRESALRAVLQFSARTQASPTLEPLLDALNTFARDITKAERSCIVLIDDARPSEVRIASSSPNQTDGGRSSVVSHTIVRRVLAERRPLLLHDIFGDSDLVQRPSIVALSLRSVLCVPLVRGDALFGVMYADNSVGAGSFDQTDLDVLTVFADQAAAAIANSRLLRDVQRSLLDLRTAQEKLIKGERLRVMGEMTSGVAHEFNNLLTAILARVQLMELGDLPDAIQSQLSIVERAALDAAEVVRRLQGFTRQQRQGTHKIVDASALCSHIVELLRPLWSSRRRHGRPIVTVRLSAPRGLEVLGDATELREVLTNLVKNAVEALDAGGSVVVVAERVDDFIHVSVRDDGPGIPPELLAKLFTPFFTTKGDKGTGLGLCLCQQIAERHGGSVSLSSESGGGTVALLRVPAAGLDKSSVTRLEMSGTAQDATSILVVDDDPNVLSPLCDYLRQSGFQVTGVSGGISAIDELTRLPPDLVLTDISMPGMDGLEVCRRAKTLVPKVPVVLMSGQAIGISPTEIRDAGASLLLAKPFTMRQVLDLIHDLTGRSGARRTAR